jgi:hypothetical protein
MVSASETRYITIVPTVQTECPASVGVLDSGTFWAFSKSVFVTKAFPEGIIHRDGTLPSTFG